VYTYLYLTSGSPIVELTYAPSIEIT
jgi:hypothetical protein